MHDAVPSTVTAHAERVTSLREAKLAYRPMAVNYNWVITGF